MQSEKLSPFLENQTEQIGEEQTLTTGLLAVTIILKFEYRGWAKMILCLLCTLFPSWKQISSAGSFALG